MTTTPFDLTDRVAVVTGASSGFGNRFAQILADTGSKVVLAARRKDRLEELEASLKAKGHEALSVACDVTQESDIIDLFDTTKSHFGRVDVLINNAGMNVQGFATDLSADDFDQIMNVNVRAVFLAAREAARHMIQDKIEGRIVNISSIGAHKVLPGLATYCTSKAAVVMMTKALAREWARNGINVNAICPGYAETEINSDWFQEEGGQRQIKSFPRKRLMRDEDLDATLLYLASAQSAFVTGSIFTIDDGQSL